MNRTLIVMARCMLLESDLPEFFWTEEVATAVYLRNRCPAKILINQKPFEIWCDRKTDVFHSKTFGCRAFALNKKLGKAKFERRWTPCIFIEYSTQCKAYRLRNIEIKKEMIRRDVRFTETFDGKLFVSKKGTPLTKIKHRRGKTIFR